MADKQKTQVLVRDLMTKRVISTRPETSVIEVAQILFEKNFDGLPVTDDGNKLLGIVTQYDLVSKGANIHLPTFIQLMRDIPLYKKDQSMIRPGLEKVVSLRVSDIMNTDPLTIMSNKPVEEASRLFTEHHRVNPIPVVGENGILEGVISRYDIIRLYTGSMAAAVTISNETSVDKKVNLFIKNFEKNFVMVSKVRTKLWLLASALFAIAGFIIAFMIIIRIQSS